jgi:hypothetical protein
LVRVAVGTDCELIASNGALGVAVGTDCEPIASNGALEVSIGTVCEPIASSNGLLGLLGYGAVRCGVSRVVRGFIGWRFGAFSDA